MSPFSDVVSSAEVGVARRLRRWILWAFCLIALCGLLVMGFWVSSIVNDPLRTLEPFPVGKYLEGYRPLAGSKFSGELRVENDLGWKEGAGRIMVFSTADDPRPVAVLIPPGLSETYFVKGQKYLAELEVREGGLIHANTIKKQ